MIAATYSIVPFEAAIYFNKIQCFCFEEQRLEPNEGKRTNMFKNALLNLYLTTC